MDNAGNPEPKCSCGHGPEPSGGLFAARYQKNYRKLTAVAAGALGVVEGAEDIVQQSAQIAISKGLSFDSEPGYVAWMVQTIRHCAVNHSRKHNRRRTYSADPNSLASVANRSAPPATLPIDPGSGDLLVDQHSFEDELQAALQELSPDARCCLLLRTLLELSYEEIATTLDLPAGTAMSHVHRSRQFLRKKLS